jgi:nucleoside-diphosphate-sugar epimerase
MARPTRYARLTRRAPIRILVTGNQGFIGPVLTRMAQDRGHQVVGLDIGYFADCGADVAPERQIVRDMRDVRVEDLDGVEAIIHLAGLSNDPMGALDESLTRDINLDATLALGRLAKQAGVGRFVFASSCSLYGAAGGEAALDETAAMAPVSAYAVSKARSEEGLSALADAGFSPVFMRNATAYGLGPRPRFDLVVNNLSGWAYATGVLKVLSDGTPWRPLVHIEDIALAALCAVEAPRQTVHDQAFNVGRSDANYRVRDIAAAVHQAFPQARLNITGESGGDPRSYRVSFDKALNSLPGFAPRWTLETGVDEVARWLSDGGLDGVAFDSRRFVRLAQLQHLRAEGMLDAQLRRVSPPD